MIKKIYVCRNILCEEKNKSVVNTSKPTQYGSTLQLGGEPVPHCQRCHQPMQFVCEEIVSKQETVLVGAISGGTVGFIFGGPAGAAIGALIGSGLGQINYEEDKRKRLGGLL